MKKLYLGLLTICFCGFLAFGDENEPEELDFLIFQPNLSNAFLNEEQATIQLDRLAQEIIEKK